MARIVPGPNVTDIRGRQYNQIYSRWKEGVYYSKLICLTPTRNCSDALLKSRERMKELSHIWVTLTVLQQALWREVGNSGYRKYIGSGGARDLIRGSAPKISGINAFSQANRLSQDVGGTDIIRAPRNDLKPPKLINGLNTTYDGARLTVKWDVPADANDNQFVRVWLGCAQEAFHKQFAVYAPVSSGRAEVLEVRGKNKIELTMSRLAGVLVYVQVDVVDRISGWSSQPSETLDVRLETAQAGAESGLVRL